MRPALAFFLAFILTVCLHDCARARDLGQWENTDPQIKKWYQTLLQPDTITQGTAGLNGTSCCGESDAYYVDVFVRTDWTAGVQIVAVIDDDRDDEKLARAHEKNGSQYVVPPNKIVGEKQRVGNPTGRAVLFLGAISNGYAGLLGEQNGRTKPRPVLCFVDDAGF